MIQPKINVLLVDDDVNFFHIIQAYLKTENLEQQVSVTFTEDINHATNFTFDLYLVDNRIRGVEKALDFVKLIQSHHSEARISVITGLADYELLKKLFQENICGFYDKNDETLNPLMDQFRAVIQQKQKLAEISKKISQF